MSALEMMMKSFGFNPAEIQDHVKKAGADFKKIVERFDAKLDLMDKKINLLLEANQLSIPLADNSDKSTTNEG